MLKNDSFIALGANLPSPIGPPHQTLIAALLDLHAHPEIQLDRISRLFTTPAFPEGSGPDYVNACARLQTTLEPEALLAVLHKIEARFGRRRDGTRWGARGLDLDLLAMGGAILPDAETARTWRDLPSEKQHVTSPDHLILPHPRMHERAFVLVPLADIAGDWHHPMLGMDTANMLAALPKAAQADIRPIAGSGWAG